MFSRPNPSDVWARDFQAGLAQERKVAMRMGELNAKSDHYTPREEPPKPLMAGRKQASQLDEGDFVPAGQKKAGVDVRTGLGVAPLGSPKPADRVVLVAGDSDFIPAAKAAREAESTPSSTRWGHDASGELVGQVDGIEGLSRR